MDQNIKLEQEQKEVIRRTAPAGKIVYQAIYEEADHELGRDSGALAWSGVAAGLSMGFSLIAQAVLAVHLSHGPWKPLVTRLGYTTGFLIVILGRQQLFTENPLTLVLPLLRNRTGSNMIGGVSLVAALAHTQYIAAGRGDSLPQE